MARPAARARIDEAVMSLRDPLLCQAMAYVVDFAEASMFSRVRDDREVSRNLGHYLIQTGMALVNLDDQKRAEAWETLRRNMPEGWRD